MKSFKLGLLAAGWLTTSLALAEVNFELPVERLESPTSIEAPSLDGMELDDRTWAILGVEDSSTPLPPLKEFDFARPPQRFRREHASSTTGHHSYLMTFPDRQRWVDEFAWPLTRHMFHGTGRGFSTGREYTFGGIAFCR